MILSPASLLLAAAGGALSAVLSAALLAALAPLGLPVLAMPFIASTQLLLLAVGAQPSPRRVRAVRGVWDSPEENLERARFLARRFPAPEVPAIFLPVLGEWLVTQGPDDQPTHQPPWADAWDLEVADDEGRPPGRAGAS